MDPITKRFNDNPELETVADNDIFPLEKMETETDGKVTFETLNKQILHNAKLEVSVDEENATLTVELKDEKGKMISTKTVDLPNTGNIDCEVDEDTAELTVQLKNTKGEVVTSDTVQLPNTSNIDCEISDDMKLTVSLKNKSGQVVTSDTVQLQSALVPSITQSEYDDLTEEEKTNGQIREITDAEGFPVPFAILNDEMTTSANVLSAQETENRLNGALAELEEKRSYSTEEHWTGKYWIDGKKIYEKTIGGLNVKLNWSDQYLARGTLPNLNINAENIIKAFCYMNQTSNDTSNEYKLSYPCAINRLGTSWLIETYQDYYVKCLTLEYTKTTD